VEIYKNEMTRHISTSIVSQKVSTAGSCNVPTDSVKF